MRKYVKCVDVSDICHNGFINTHPLILGKTYICIKKTSYLVKVVCEKGYEQEYQACRFEDVNLELPTNIKVL